jgi:hypothetical protein
VTALKSLLEMMILLWMMLPLVKVPLLVEQLGEDVGRDRADLRGLRGQLWSLWQQT